MEGNYWLRLAFIGMLFVGSVYVLLPTVLDDAEIAVTDVDLVQEKEPPLEVWFTTEDGQPDAETVAALDARLQAADIGVERAVLKDDRIIVFKRLGSPKATIERVAVAGGTVGLYGFPAAGLDASNLAELTDEQIDGAVAAASLASGAEALSGDFKATQADDGSLSFDRSPADGADAWLLVIDGNVAGWVKKAESGATVRLTGANTEADAQRVLAGPAGEPVKRLRFEAPKVEAQAEEVEEEEAELTWWEPLLLDRKLSLGLDLQGGIDLTLQVDQDAAVIANVQRDRRQLADKAVEDGKDVLIERDRTRYALKLSSNEAFSDLRAWVDENLRGEYIYVDTTEADGVTWNVWELSEQRVAQINEQAVEQNLETLRKRVDATGVKEPSIVKMGGGRINVQLPGVSDAQQAMDALGEQATLQFRMYDHDSDTNSLRIWSNEAKQTLSEAEFNDIELLNTWLRDKGYVPEDRIVLWSIDEEDAEGNVLSKSLMQLHQDIVLTGADVDNANVGFDQNNFPRVSLDFKPRGGRIFCDVSTANVGKRFAIILDGEVRSAPNIREAICGGSASIDMGNSAGAVDEANTLALVLRTGALTAPVEIGQVREIGSSLGADAVQAGKYGAGIGGLVILLFMGLWYRRAGWVANVALALNMLLVFAALTMFEATLTLPGIAGIALTIGMAVDANIIIYERIREELRLGVSARKAVDTGYDKGLVAVLDANVTTFIAGVVLYSYGTGPIKGFAVTLMIGIGTTLITALFVTRTFMEIMTRQSDARLKI